MTREVLKQAIEAMKIAQDNLRPHKDNCFLHDEGEYNRCFCGKDSLSDHLQSVVESLEEALKQEQGEPLENDPLPRACNLAGVDYQTFLKIKAYMPVCTTPQPKQEQDKIVEYEYFKNWMVKEMPQMTIIGNPEWWAMRIYDKFMYTKPQKRKPMKDKQIDEIPFALFAPDQDGMSTTEELRKFARAIEAAHGIKE